MHNFIYEWIKYNILTVTWSYVTSLFSSMFYFDLCSVVIGRSVGQQPPGQVWMSLSERTVALSQRLWGGARPSSPPTPLSFVRHHAFVFLSDILPPQTGSTINRFDILTYSFDILMY